MAYKQKQSSCAKMVDAKGKPSGLMMAGSAYHMESISQEKKNLVNDMPVDGKASAMEMSPYKMDYDSPAKKTDPKTNVDEFGNPIPKDFKADAKGVTGTVRQLSSTKGVKADPLSRDSRSQLVEGGLSKGEDFASGGFGKAQLIKEGSQAITTRENLSAKQKKAVMQSRSYSGKKSPKDVAKILGIKPTITTVKVDE